MSTSSDRAQEFLGLHRPGDPFVLPCVWDVATAKLLVQRGFPAIGTTSLGMAASHGLRDEARATRRIAGALVADLRRAQAAPLLSCDIEDGYSDAPDEVAGFIRTLDVQGVNIEDSASGSLTDPELLVQKIRAVKAAAPDVFVNARVDTFWLNAGGMIETRARLERYVDAGADGIFVPGDLELDQIAEIAGAFAVPLNVLVSARHPRSALADAGVARISSGSLLYRGALHAALRIADRLGAGELPDAEAVSYGAVQDLAARER